MPLQKWTSCSVLSEYAFSVKSEDMGDAAPLKATVSFIIRI
jgi:hypothetical protein